MAAAKVFLVLLCLIVAGEATVLPLIKAFFGKDFNLDTSGYYTQDDCIYPSEYNGYASGYYGYPSGYNGYASEYNGYASGYNGYASGYNGYANGYNGYGYGRGYPRGYYPRRYAGYNGYARGYNGYPRGYYSGYNDVYLRTDAPRQGKTWTEICNVHYPDSSGAPGKAGVVCL